MNFVTVVLMTLPLVCLGQTKTPSICYITKEQIKYIGDTVELQCFVKTAEYFPVSWVKINRDPDWNVSLSTGNSLRIRDSRFSIRHKNLDSTYSTYTLQIKDIQESDNGTYKCEVFLAIGNKITEISVLHVLPQPVVTSGNPIQFIVAFQGKSNKPSWAGQPHSPHNNQHGHGHQKPQQNPVEITSANAQTDSCPTIFTRKQWRARKPLKVYYNLLPVEYIIIHHTVTESCNMERKCIPIVQNIQNYHMSDVKLDDIGYNFLIGGDGSIFEGVGWHKTGAHTYGYNSRSIGIAFMGNFENYAPTKKAVQAARDLIECGISKKELSLNVKVFAALQVQQTLSPGENLYEEIKTWPHWAEAPEDS
ncbi:Peptidoglycan-recognition protein [Sergentomyia squamirostris]